jgi:hypothetical protein
MAKMDKLTQMLLELEVQTGEQEAISPAVKLARRLLEAGKVRVNSLRMSVRLSPQTHLRSRMMSTKNC